MLGGGGRVWAALGFNRAGGSEIGAVLVRLEAEIEVVCCELRRAFLLRCVPGVFAALVSARGSPLCGTVAVQ